MGINHLCPVAGTLPVKIVYFIDHLRPDGTQKMLTQLVSGMAERGYQQSVVCLNDSWDDNIVNLLRNTGSEVRIVGKPALLLGFGLLSTWLWLRNNHFQAAITFLFASDVVGRTLARLAGIPRIVTSIQARNTNYAQWQRWLVRKTMPWADIVEICSEQQRDFVIEEEGADPDQICLIHHSIRVEDYVHPVNKVAFRNKYGLGDEVYIIGSVGRLFPQKGYDVLLSAFEMLNLENVHLLIAGTGDELATLEGLTVDLGIKERVHFLGHLRDVPNFLRGIDLYVQASRFEGMSIAMLEAMASKCPIVATAVDGARELIHDGEHGWLVPTEDPKALAKAIEYAYTNPLDAKQCAIRARQRVEEQFSVEDMILSWEALISDNGNYISTTNINKNSDDYI